MLTDRPDHTSPLRISFDALERTLVSFESALRQFHDELIADCIDFFSRRIADMQDRLNDKEVDDA